MIPLTLKFCWRENPKSKGQLNCYPETKMSILHVQFSHKQKLKLLRKIDTSTIFDILLPNWISINSVGLAARWLNLKAFIWKCVRVCFSRFSLVKGVKNVHFSLIRLSISLFLCQYPDYTHLCIIKQFLVYLVKYSVDCKPPPLKIAWYLRPQKNIKFSKRAKQKHCHMSMFLWEEDLVNIKSHENQYRRML